MEKEHKRQTHTNRVFIALVASRMACRAVPRAAMPVPYVHAAG